MKRLIIIMIVGVLSFVNPVFIFADDTNDQSISTSVSVTSTEVLTSSTSSVGTTTETTEIVQPPAPVKLTASEIYKENSKSLCEVRMTVPDTNDQKYSSMATGFFVSDSGHVATSFHLFDNEIKTKTIILRGKNGQLIRKQIKNMKLQVFIPHTNRIYDLEEITGVNDYADATVVKIDLSAEDGDYKPVSLGNSTKLLAGQELFVIGSPFGLSKGMAKGIVRRTHITNDFKGFLNENIELDIHIFAGNSGSPIFDEYGTVVAMAQGIWSRANNNISYGVPVHCIMIEKLLTGHIRVPSLGATLVELPIAPIEKSLTINNLKLIERQTKIQDVKTLLNLYELTKTTPEGVVVTEFFYLRGFAGMAIAPTKEAGVKLGDIIVAIDEIPVKSKVEVGLTLVNKNLKKKVLVTLWRYENNVATEYRIEVPLVAYEPTN